MNLEYILQTHGLIGRSSGKSKDEIPPPPITNFLATVVNETIKLTWTNPNDTDFIGLLIIGKNSNYPAGINDGDIVLNKNIEDGGTISTEVIDSNITKGIKRYYRAFPYDWDRNYQTDTGQQANAIVKISQTAPSIPTMASRTSTSITLNSISGCEYKIASGNWQDSVVFSGLSIVTEYTFYIRKKETDTHYASPSSNGAKFKTDKGTQSVPSAPNVTNIEHDRATVTGVSGTEVRLDNGIWYDSPHTFTNLTEETEYNAYARMKETLTHYASDSSFANNFTTSPEQKIYGVRIVKNNSNPETRVTYIGDSVGFTPMYGNNGSLQWGSWGNILEDYGIKPCLLKNTDVQYYLNPNDFTKKADDSNAVLTGNDGDVMIEFSKTIWTKWTDEGDTYTIEMSEKEFDGAKKYAFEVENGYNIVPYYPLKLTQEIYVILFKSTDSQTALGRGRVDGATGYASTGNTNTKGMFYGSENDEQMKFLGIEDYWGNKYWWIEGLVTDSNRKLLIGKENFNDTGNGYISYESGVISNTSGYITEIQGGNEKGFIIKQDSGAGNQYYCDYGNLCSSCVALFGGYRSYGSSAGFAYLRLYNSASYSHANMGARLFCAKNGKIYIGAYLGTTVGGKLRSISGSNEPTGNKIIGTFRTEARANN